MDQTAANDKVETIIDTIQAMAIKITKLSATDLR